MVKKALVSLVALALATISRADLLVGNLHGDNVLRYSDSGTFMSVFASGAMINGPQGLAVGPDGNVYVGSEYTHNITKLAPDGTFLGEFAAAGPQDIEFGPDGHLYVLPHLTLASPGSILKFSTAGTFLGYVGDAMSSGHTHGLAWGTDAHIYQGSLAGPGTAVVEIDPVTGSTIGPFIIDGDLTILNDLEFGPDGHLYASNPLAGGSTIVGGIYRYDGATGAFMDVFSTVGAPTGTWGITFKETDVYYSAGGGVAKVGSAGGLASAFVTPGSGGLTVATGLAFIPAVPEPASLLVLLAGVVALRRRRA